MPISRLLPSQATQSLQHNESASLLAGSYRCLEYGTDFFESAQQPKISVQSRAQALSRRLEAMFSQLPINISALSQLVDEGARINRNSKIAIQLLFRAAREDQPQLISLLKKAGLDLNVRDTKQDTALHMAARAGHVAAINALCAAGASVNADNIFAATPLYCAALNGKVEAIKALIHAGAQIDVVNCNGWSPLYAAATKGHTAAVEALQTANPRG